MIIEENYQPCIQQREQDKMNALRQGRGIRLRYK